MVLLTEFLAVLGKKEKAVQSLSFLRFRLGLLSELLTLQRRCTKTNERQPRFLYGTELWDLRCDEDLREKFQLPDSLYTVTQK